MINPPPLHAEDVVKRANRILVTYNLTLERWVEMASVWSGLAREDCMDFMVGNGDDQDMRAIWAAVVRVEHWERKGATLMCETTKQKKRRRKTEEFLSTVSASEVHGALPLCLD